MSQYLGLDLANIINTSVGPGLLAATLIQSTVGTRTGGSLTAGTNPTLQNFTATGFIDTYEDSKIDGTLIKRKDRKITLLGASIQGGAIPSTGDRIDINSETFNIVGQVIRDPAGATYECQGRR